MLISELIKNWRSVSGRASRIEFVVITTISILALIATFFLAVKVFEIFFGDFHRAFHHQISSGEYMDAVLQAGLSEWLQTGSVNGTMAGVNQYAKNYENESIKHMMLSSLSFILFLPFAVMWIAGAVRRLHDIGTFGWWVFIVLVPIYLFLPNWLIIAPLLFLFFKDGQRFYNKYGTDPKNPDAPIPLEMPKRSENLADFENKVLGLVEKVKIFLQLYWLKILAKIKK